MKKLALCLMVFLSFIVNAQINVEQIDPGSVSSNLQIHLANAPIIEMPEFNIKWIEEEEKETNEPSVTPPRFGYAYETEINNLNDGKWTREGDFSIWTLTIKSKGALSINLIFDEFSLSEGSEFNIYNDTKTVKFGPVSLKNNKASRKLSTDIIKGSSITLVLKEPYISENEKSIISIGYVIHGYTAACDFGDATLNCHINASCSQADDLEDEKYAVARILVWCNTRCCTGSMINNACNCPDYTPYFLTAFHCIDYNEDRILNEIYPTEQDDPETWAFSFKYISPNCTPSSEPSSWKSYTGAEFKAYNSETDFLLVEMEDQPIGSTGITYSGWSRDDEFDFQDEGTSSLHHPGGDVLKYSSDDEEPVVNEDSKTFCYAQNSCWDMDPGTLWEVEFDNGSIEGGSSGSPLYDPNGRIIGQCVGTALPAHCPPTPGFYGRLSESWAMSQNNDEQLAHWLDPDNTGAMSTSTVGIPYISGPEFVCYSPNTAFTLHNRPAGTTVNWTYNSSLLYLVSGQGTNNLTVRAKTQYVRGEGWVQATISKGACDPLSFGLDDFWVGRFQNTWVSGIPGVCPNTTYTYTATVPFGNPSSYSYSWTYPSNWSKISQEHNVIKLRTPSYPYYGTVRVSIENDCGWSDPSGITVYPGYCGGYYMASPNPADEYIELNIDKEKISAESISLGSEWVLTMVDNMGVVKYIDNLWEFPYRINTSKLPGGLYIINLFNNGKMSSVRVIIKH